MSENTNDRFINTLLDDRYQIEELIGEGGMAVVYRATDNRLNRQVAVKIMRPEFAADEDFIEDVYTQTLNFNLYL